MNKHKSIGVAVIWNQYGKILIDRRKNQGSFGGFWEFPGGKIELGETIEDCIIREIREELDLHIVVREHLITVDHVYNDFAVTLNVYNCDYISGEPQLLECTEIRWIVPQDLINYNFPEANIHIIRAILALL